MALRIILLCLFLLIACNYSENERHQMNLKGHAPVEDGLTREDYNIENHHNRRKRAVAEKEEIFLQINIPGSFDLKLAKESLNNLTFPIQLNNLTLTGVSIKITEIALITVCEPVNQEIHCSCESEFQWNSTFCNRYATCDSNGQNCSCIKGVPAGGAYCEPKHPTSTIASTITQPTTTTTTPTTTPTTTTPTTTTPTTTTPTTTTPTTTTPTTTTPTTTTPTTTTPTTTTPTITTTIPPNLKTQRGAIKLAQPFIAALLDPTTGAFKNLKSKMEAVLSEAYSGSISGVIVQGFSNGSIEVYYDLMIDQSANDVPIPDNIKVIFKNSGYTAEPFKDANIPCFDPDYGKANYQETASRSCSGNSTRQMNRTCRENGKYGPVRSFCLLKNVDNLLQDVQNSTFVVENLGNLLQELSNTSIQETETITNPGNLIAVVDILQIFSDVTNVSIDEKKMEHFLDSVSAIIGENSTDTWKFVASDENNGDNADLSSKLLKSVETFTTFLPDNTTSFSLNKTNLQLQATKIDQGSTFNYSVTFDNFINSGLSGSVFIDQTHFPRGADILVVSIGYPTLNDILSSNASFSKDFDINSLVTTTTVGKNNVTTQLTFSLKNESFNLDSGVCAFWNFNLFRGKGGWDNTGCSTKRNGNIIVCNCTHLTSFSILMSPFSPSDRELAYITNIGIAVSMGSLVISIIIEAMVWKFVTKNKTSYTRHLAILNIAISLLVADIWFIVGAAVKPNTKACTAATFFIHFFYLALFFWMLTLGLLLVYRLIFVFHEYSKSIMRTASLIVGYLCPLIIAVITIGVAHPRDYYTRSDACWLGWKEHYPLLAFIIPALLIITINVIILIIVIVKLLRKTVGNRSTSQSQERDTFKQIVRSVAILTPILGLTWGFGIPTFQEGAAIGFHYVFTILNSFQGFFILVFATLMDNKVREAILKKFSLSGFSSRTKPSQSTTTTKPPVSKPVTNIFGKTGHYSVARQFHSSDLSSSQIYSTLD